MEVKSEKKIVTLGWYQALHNASTHWRESEKEIN